MFGVNCGEHTTFWIIDFDKGNSSQLSCFGIRQNMNLQFLHDFELLAKFLFSHLTNKCNVWIVQLLKLLLAFSCHSWPRFSWLVWIWPAFCTSPTTRELAYRILQPFRFQNNAPLLSCLYYQFQTFPIPFLICLQLPPIWPMALA
jgi:hypothetical protein